MARKPKHTVRLAVEALEAREVPAVMQMWYSGNMLVVRTDNADTRVELNQSGSQIEIKDLDSGDAWYRSASAVEFQGGTGNDFFENNIATLAIRAFGGGGNDHLIGYNAADYLVGGDGHDTLVGWGGNDSIWGGIGDDVLLGRGGHDKLYGEDGNDRLNGREGRDSLWGGNDDDVLIAIDGGYRDYTEGESGRDTYWIDRNGSDRDKRYGVASDETVHYVERFANGANRSLDGDRIADPTATAGYTYKTFAGNPLFSSAGPQVTDVRQGDLGDCWVLAGLGAIANDNAFAVRRNVVDFDDGTYGVRLGSKFYRVDNDLAAAGTSPAYAQLGAQNSMWVAVVEKAYAHYRTGANSYASLISGWSVDVNRAFGTTAAGDKTFGSYSDAAALANEVYNRWDNYEAVTVAFVDGRYADGKPLPNVPLINGHQYTVMSVTRNSSGVVTAVQLRNPWAVDGAGNDANPNDGLVTVTPDQVYQFAGRVNWGKV